jgi:hypothetical protein
MITSLPFRALALFLVVVSGSVDARAGEIVVNARDLALAPSGVRLAAGLRLPGEDRALGIVADGAGGTAAELLRRLDAEGAAHGFSGIVYDNRDRGHSRLRPELFPRLSHLAYGFELVVENADYGLAGGILLPAVVFGNSSTAVTSGPQPRSLTRLAMTGSGLPAAQARLFLSDHLYVYPEHRDHDEADLFPANWTYTLTSQGSSGSDRPFLEAIAMTLAAFPRDTFDRLREERLVASTLQMILRRSLATVTTREDYLTGAAHPVVFDATLLRPDRMVTAAAALGPDAIPPLVRIEVVEEDFGTAGGLAALDERLFDTPSAIARIWRDFAWEREMIVSAEATRDPGGRPLTFSWRLLQGVPERVAIEPLDPDGRRARIRLRWHDAFEVEGPDALRRTSRVDIGVFASNGATDSAPAILSVSFPAHQLRTYGPDEDGDIRLQSVDYDAEAREEAFDPVLHWSAPWTDLPVFDAGGALRAWQRTGRNGWRARVLHDGGATGTVHYVIDRRQPARPVLTDARNPAP